MIEIEPAKHLDVSVHIPASKSYANRALIVSSLAYGMSTLNDVLLCDDTKYLVKNLKNLGVTINQSGTILFVSGTGGNIKINKGELFVGNAGTSLRFLTSFVALLTKERVVINGDERMNQRPVQDLIDGLKQMGSDVKSMNDNGCPPILIRKGFFKGGEVSLDGTRSSQYLSSLLMCAPYAENDVKVKIDGELVSKPYIDVTLKVMNDFGVFVENKSYKEFFVKSGQRYKAREYNVEGDASSASYFFAAAAITGGTVRVYNINPNTLQGDINFLKLLEEMGCTVYKKNEYIEVKGGKLKGIDVDMNSMPDIVQTVTMVALFADGETKISNVHNLRIKETDRLRAISNELKKAGANVIEKEDGLIIYPIKDIKPCVVETYNDHRMAMSFALLGLKVKGIKIKNPQCVSKSFPGFFEKLSLFWTSVKD